jgi:hypothetical protein
MRSSAKPTDAGVILLNLQNHELKNLFFFISGPCHIFQYRDVKLTNVLTFLEWIHGSTWCFNMTSYLLLLDHGIYSKYGAYTAVKILVGPPPIDQRTNRNPAGNVHKASVHFPQSQIMSQKCESFLRVDLEFCPSSRISLKHGV